MVHDRRQRVGRRCQHPVRGCSELCAFGECADRILDRVGRNVHAGSTDLAQQTQVGAGLVCHCVTEPLGLVQHMDVGRCGHLPLGCIGLEVEQFQHDPNAADAVGDRMVELHDDRVAPISEAVDDQAFPLRPSAVEALHRHGLDHSQQVAHRSLLGYPCEAQVVVEVKDGVDLPTGRGQ